MATLVVEKPKKTQEYINLAKKRVKFPEGWQEMEYRHESDLLLIRFSDRPTATSKADISKGLVYNYDRNKKLVSIEVLDLYDVFV
jgi:hypothetical protein